MRIQYVTTVAGPGGVFHAGHEVEVSEDRGRLLVAQGAAFEVKSEVQPAAASAPAIQLAEAPNVAVAAEPPAPQRPSRPAARTRG